MKSGPRSAPSPQNEPQDMSPRRWNTSWPRMMRATGMTSCPVVDDTNATRGGALTYVHVPSAIRPVTLMPATTANWINQFGLASSHLPMFLRVVDVRRTMRASLETGGVPLRLRYRPKRPRRPEIYVLCDVSTSVSSASVFFLSVLHALHDSFRRLRSFVFIERISEVTEVFEHERDFRTIAQRISSEGGVADVSGYTDYGRVWLEFLAEISDELDPRSTVIVLGDARTNGREPHAEVFAQVAERAGRLFWLNPEPRLYWNYGDSVMAA